MRHSEIMLLYDYNYWANQKLMATAAHCAPDELMGKSDAMWDSILGTLVHVLGAEGGWRRRIQEDASPAGPLDRSSITTLEQLRTTWAREEEAMRAYLHGLRDDDLDKVIRYQNARGEPLAFPLWQILMHVVNHGTQHRAEAALYLTNLGHSPGDVDLSRYLPQR